MVRIRDVGWAFAAPPCWPGARAASPTRSPSPGMSPTTSRPPTAARDPSVTIPVGASRARRRTAPMGPDGSTRPTSWSAASTCRTSGSTTTRRPTRCTSGIQGFTNVAGQQEIFGDVSGNLNPALDQLPSSRRCRARPTPGGDKSVAIAFAPIATTPPARPSGHPVDHRRHPGGQVAGRQRHDRRVHRLASTLPTARASHSSFGSAVDSATPATWPSTPRPRIPTSSSRSTTSARSPASTRANGFCIEVYDGIGRTASDGQSPVRSGSRSPRQPQNINAPEPDDLAGLAALAGGAGWRYRRRAGGSPVIRSPGWHSACITHPCARRRHSPGPPSCSSARARARCGQFCPPHRSASPPRPNCPTSPRQAVPPSSLPGQSRTTCAPALSFRALTTLAVRPNHPHDADRRRAGGLRIRRRSANLHWMRAAHRSLRDRRLGISLTGHIMGQRRTRSVRRAWLGTRPRARCIARAAHSRRIRKRDTPAIRQVGEGGSGATSADPSTTRRPGRSPAASGCPGPSSASAIDGYEDYKPLPGAAQTSDEKLLVYYRPLRYKSEFVDGSTGPISSRTTRSASGARRRSCGRRRRWSNTNPRASSHPSSST